MREELEQKKKSLLENFEKIKETDSYELFTLDKNTPDGTRTINLTNKEWKECSFIFTKKWDQFTMGKMDENIMVTEWSLQLEYRDMNAPRKTWWVAVNKTKEWLFTWNIKENSSVMLKAYDPSEYNIQWFNYSDLNNNCLPPAPLQKTSSTPE